MTEQPSWIDEVLLSDEDVEWARDEDVDWDKYLFFPSIAFVVLIFVVLSFFDPSYSNFWPLQLFGSLFIIVAIYVYIRKGRNPVWYFITSKRIFETKGKQIIMEIDRTSFGDLPLHEFISMRIVRYESESGNKTHYCITIHDPETSEPLIMFNRIWFTYVEDYSLFQDMQDCSSCGVQISSKLEKCLGCGHSLV